jgi:hypothetical protein
MTKEDRGGIASFSPTGIDPRSLTNGRGRTDSKSGMQIENVTKNVTETRKID